MIKVAVLGYGNIGSGVVQVLSMNKECIKKTAGQEIEVKAVLDLREFPGDPMEDRVVHDINQIVNDPEIQIVVETMGGTKPAYNFVKACLEAGKSVATSNKELVAKHGAELMRIAEEKQINFLFEASVGGGIPIIRPLNQCITSDEVYEITGILNGTTNYMLTNMAKKGMTFDAILKKAQDLGYAERNPEADVEGFDACRKIAILSSLAFGAQVDYEDIHTEGITKISDVDMKYALQLGKAIKLFGTSKKTDGKIYAMVSPVMVGEEHPLYSVNEVMNGILVRGDVIGDLMFYGAGAGKLPTASAVVADVVEEAKNPHRTTMRRWSEEKLNLSNFDDAKSAFFIRVSGDAKERKAELETVFGQTEVVTVDGVEGEFAVLTEEMTEAEYRERAEAVSGILNRIRLAK